MKLITNKRINSRLDQIVIRYETFEYYSNSPQPFYNLLSVDKEIFKYLLGLENGKLYALMQIPYLSEYEPNLGIFKYWSLNDQSDGFKYVIDFDKPIFEYEKQTDKYNYVVGLAEISLEFYLENYSFFNHEGDNIGLIIVEETKLTVLIELIKKYNGCNTIEKRYDGLLDFSKLLEKLTLEGNCISLFTNDTQEFKIMHMNILSNNRIKILNYLSTSAKKFLRFVHFDEII